MAKKIGDRSGGAGMTKGNSLKDVASTEEILVAVRAELSSLKAASAVATADAVDLATAIALANSLKVTLNNIAAIVDGFVE